VAKIPSFEAHALLIMGVSSLQSSMNFFLSLSFCVFDLEYAGKNRAQEDTLPVNHSPCASLMTMGAKMFWISASVKWAAMLVRDLVAYSLTTVSSTFARFSKRGMNAVLSGKSSLTRSLTLFLPDFT
jgi:hypothetical protein